MLKLPTRLPKRLALLALALFFVVAGANHFVNRDFYLGIMPPSLPAPLALVYLSGVLEILGGIAVLIPRVRVLAGWGLVLLLVAVFPANLHMALNADLFPASNAVGLYIRIPIQGLLIAWAYLATRPDGAASTHTGARGGRRVVRRHTTGGPMSLSRLVPMQPVTSMPTSVAFYEKLGFVVESRNDEWGWAMLQCGDVQIMLDQSINIHAGIPRIAVLYLYPTDVAAFHHSAREHGLTVSELDVTFYGMTEFRIEDPDGNRLWIGQGKGMQDETA